MPKIDHLSCNIIDIRNAVFEGPTSKWLINRTITVPIGEFVIFLAIQLANRTSQLTCKLTLFIFDISSIVVVGNQPEITRADSITTAYVPQV